MPCLGIVIGLALGALAGILATCTLLRWLVEAGAWAAIHRIDAEHNLRVEQVRLRGAVARPRPASGRADDAGT